MATTPVYQGSKGNYSVYVDGRLVGTVTGAGKAWLATFTAGQHTPTTYTGTTRAAAVTAMLAGATLAPAAPAVPNGNYTPAAPGATTWRNARPLYVDHQAVTAHVATTPQGQTLAVFVGTRLAYQGPLPAEITAGHMVNPWVADFALRTATPPAAPQGGMAQRPRSAPAPQGPAAAPAAAPVPRAPRHARTALLVALVALLVALRAVGWGARLVVLPYVAVWWVATRGARAVAPLVASAYATRTARTA